MAELDGGKQLNFEQKLAKSDFWFFPKSVFAKNVLPELDCFSKEGSIFCHKRLLFSKRGHFCSIIAFFGQHFYIFARARSCLLEPTESKTFCPCLILRLFSQVSFCKDATRTDFPFPNTQISIVCARDVSVIPCPWSVPNIIRVRLVDKVSYHQKQG